MGPVPSKPASVVRTSNPDSGTTTTTTTFTPPAAEERRLIGDYELLRRIGMGGEAIVYTARSIIDDRIYVLKAIRPTINNPRNNPEHVTQLLSRFVHPSIVAFKECFIHRNHNFMMPVDQVCIVMEYCSGGDLYAKIQQLQRDVIRLPEEWIMKWMIELVEALAYLHSQNLIHRDLKPENIFLTEHYSVKLGDFGVSRILDDSGHAKTFTGTMCYMAPEMLLPPENMEYGAGVDIWALGCIAFELTAPSSFIFEMQHNRLPGFVLRKRGDTPDDEESLLRIEHEQHQTMRALISPSYSEEFKQLIFQMLRANPLSRISASDILKLPYVTQWKERLTTQPPPVDQLEGLLLCRSFHWQGMTWITTRKGDITQEPADVIVVPTDEMFSCKSGLSRIVCARDPSLVRSLKSAINERAPPGMAVPIYTPIGEPPAGLSVAETLKAKGVLHVVGPASTTMKANEWLERTFHNCLRTSADLHARSLCFPAIGTGGGGIPASQCANAFFRVIRQGVPHTIESITLLCNDLETLRAFSEAYTNIIQTRED